MKSYVPNTSAQREAMLREIGLERMDQLFADIPAGLRLGRALNLPAGKSELEVRRLFASYRAETDASKPIFRGAGAYRHYIPAAVPQLAGQTAFYTAYTPYQAEMSQGMLQSIFEYQTLICELTGMDASNASVYDGATAAAESLIMMRDAKRKKKILYSAGLNPEVKATLITYAHFTKLDLVEIPLDKTGLVDCAALEANSADAAGFIVSNPNFYGCIEDIPAIAEIVHAAGGLLTAYVNPISLGLIKRPGDSGADIAIGDGQPLGLPLGFGGPYVGFVATKEKYTRNLPGRIAGQTADADGNRAFVLTLQAREQHIRRDKAASNICSNQMLCAIMSSIYLALMGPDGIAEVADQCVQKAHYLAEGISRIKGMSLRYCAPFFHEFVVDSAVSPAAIEAKLRERGIIGGLALERFDPKDTGILYCATECNTREEIDALLSALEVIA
ncbi:MAG: aminomethyl-transferring glycine dehydrogenase subunit GcvPA [Bacillota bacterium]